MIQKLLKLSLNDYFGKMRGAGPSKSMPKEKRGMPAKIIFKKFFFVSGMQFRMKDMAT